MSEHQYAENLNRARSLAKDIPKTPRAALKEVASLLTQLNPFMDWLYGIALALALLKDILDFTLIGSLPVIGTVITIMISLSIGFIMLLTGSFFSARWARRLGVLLAGTGVELFFGLNFFPIETFIVVMVFHMTLKQRKEKSDQAKKEMQAAEMQQNYAT